MNMHAYVGRGRSAAGVILSQCRLCGAALEHTFVDLGMLPLCESFLTRDDLAAAEPYFPLHVQVCAECFLVQLKEYARPAHISSDYACFSSHSAERVEHAKAYCAAMTRRMPLGCESLVVEVASNDGYLLQHFLPLGIPVLGIEPVANVAKVAIQKRIPCRVDLFGAKLADELVDEGQRADLIVANNVLDRVPELNDFMAGMARLLKPEGLITVELPHLERLIAENQLDAIHHEHFCYFSLLTVERLAARHGLRLIDVEELPIRGGSLRVYFASADSAWEGTLNVADLRSREHRLGFQDLGAYAAFGEQVKRTKRRLLSLLIAAKDEGKRICGYGAPGEGNTLLNYCGVGTDLLDFTVDRNPGKHGRYTPGMHIPIHPVEALCEARPDLILILPWSPREEIMAQIRAAADWGAKLVVPIPEATIIDPRELIQELHA